MKGGGGEDILSKAELASSAETEELLTSYCTTSDLPLTFYCPTATGYGLPWRADQPALWPPS